MLELPVNVGGCFGERAVDDGCLKRRELDTTLGYGETTRASLILQGHI